MLPATVFDRHWPLKCPFLIQRKHRASLVGHECREWESVPQRLHNLIFCCIGAPAGMAGSFLLGACLTTKSNAPSPFLGFLKVSCCSFMVSL